MQQPKQGCMYTQPYTHTFPCFAFFMGLSATSTPEVLASVRICHDVTGNRVRSKVLFKCRSLRFVVRKDSGSLSILRCREIRKRKLTLKIRNLFVLGVDLVVAHLVENSLRPGVLCRDNVAPDRVQCLSVSAVFRNDRAVKVRGRKPVLATTLRKLLLKREVLVHVSHLTAVRGNLSLRETVAKCLIHTRETSRQSVLQSGDTFPVVLCLIHPRIKRITGHAATTAESSVVAETATEDQEEQDNPETVTLSPTGVVAHDCAIVGRTHSVFAVRHTVFSFA